MFVLVVIFIESNCCKRYTFSVFKGFPYQAEFLKALDIREYPRIWNYKMTDHMPQNGYQLEVNI